MSVGLCLRLRIPREPWAFVFALALPAISKATVGPGALFNRCSVIRVLSRGYKRDLSGSQATHPAPLPCSETPAESVILALPDFPMLPPVPTRRRLQRAHDFEANTRLRYPLSTLHERRCRHPCKTCFRLAGSAFAGRASNPLGHKERFQATSILLSRAYPDASRVHARRYMPLSAGLLHPAAPFPRRARESAENSVICATHCSAAPVAPRLNLRCVIFVTAIRAMKIAMGRGANHAWGIDLRFDG